MTGLLGTWAILLALSQTIGCEARPPTEVYICVVDRRCPDGKWPDRWLTTVSLEAGGRQRAELAKELEQWMAVDVGLLAPCPNDPMRPDPSPHLPTVYCIALHDTVVHGHEVVR